MSSRTWEKAFAVALVVYASVVAIVLLGPRKCALRAWLSQLRHCWRPKKMKAEEAARERLIRAECETKRMERARRFLVLFNLVNLFKGSLLLMCISKGILLRKLMVIGADIFASSTMALFSRRLTARALDGYFCFCILIVVSLNLVHEPSVANSERERAVTLVNLVYVSVADLKPWLNGLGFLCAATAETLNLSLAGSPSSAGFGWFAYAIGFAGVLGLDLCLKRSVRMEILAADSQNELEAIKTLLDSICDVIVQLDSRLRVKQHSPKLAEVLLVQAPGKSVEGMDLRSHMATEQDRAIFADRLQGSPVAAAHATVFHAKMRDSASSSIDMEFFSVSFKGRDGDQHHILGMREFTDIRPVLPLRHAQPAQPTPLPLPTQNVAALLASPPPPPLPPHSEPVGAPLPSERAAGQFRPGAPRGLELHDLCSRGSPSPCAPSSESGDSVPDAALRDSNTGPGSPVVPVLRAEVIGAPRAASKPPWPAPSSPACQASRPAFRERGGRRVGLGTPAVLEQSDIRSHRSTSPRAPRSEPGDSGGGAAGDGGPAHPFVETAAFVRELSVNYLLTSWSLRMPPGSCCPKHAALLRLESLVARMKSKQCAGDFGPETDWQCPRCGIMADEYRDPGHQRKCLICQHVSDSCLQRSGDEGGSSRMAL